MWIGAKKYSADSIKTRWKLSWGATKFKLLGVTFDVDLNKVIRQNYSDKIGYIKNSIKHWQRRFLTPLGKIIVIKSLLLPKITHLLIALPNPDLNILNEINDVLYDFLWNGQAKIKQSVVIKQYFEGGLKVINIKTYAEALKLTWIRRILQKESKWQLLLKTLISVEKLFCCGSEYIKSTLPLFKNDFWKDVLKAPWKFELLLEVDFEKTIVIRCQSFIIYI